MFHFARQHWPLGLLAVMLAVILTITLLPYHGNPSALFHMDASSAEKYNAPKHFVVLQVPGYDGEQYYEIATQMPNIVRSSHWPLLTNTPTIAYSYQRFLLPVVAYLLSFGQIPLLPYSFLFVQLASLFCACGMMLSKYPKKALYALALALSPPALIGLHFSLAEPLTLLILTLFLTRFINRNSLRATDVILLSLFVLTREVNILFIGVLLLYLLWNRRWQDCFLLIIPAASFAALHTMIYGIFGEVPFFWSTDKHALPLTAILQLLSGERGYNMYTLSAIALFLGFVLPAFLWSGWNLWKKNMNLFLPFATFVFLCVMLAMPDHIWGSITSIGRVITPVYPLFLLQAAERDTLCARLISLSILLLGLGAGLSLALIKHSYILS